MKPNNYLILSIILLFVINTTSCVRDTFNPPPGDCIDVSLTTNYTIKELKTLFDGSSTVV